MSIVDQIIDLNTVAMMGGTELDRIYMTKAEFRRMMIEINPGKIPDEPEPGFVGCVVGVPLIIREPIKTQWPNDFRQRLHDAA
ncbi:hypothetical protein O4H29_06750 [Marinobacter salarius]|uniref:hypothetical protein n=1 Tax=Marinobacter salarius TaxID=1420917 RepID=UPI0022B0E00E|nr:hypothetical protein [Marinobacter salarius]MCZ4284531.1 hypothetical protein [Marinobacter salarius]